jgi:hypothetical protein
MTLEQFGGGFSDGVIVRGRAAVWTLGLDDGLLLLPSPSGDGRFPNLKVNMTVSSENGGWTADLALGS